jgi:AraC family transcriptional regulator
MTKSGEAIWMQRDDDGSAVYAAQTARGESGVSVTHLQFQRFAQFKASPTQHLVFMQLSPRLRLDCRVAGGRLRHEPITGGIAILPAGVDGSVGSNTTADVMVVAVKPGRLALAAADDLAVEAQLRERIAGHDRTLLEIARRLAAETQTEHANGLRLWNDTADDFIHRLLLAHTRAPDASPRSRLGLDVLRRIRDYVHAHLAEPIEVNDLASLAGRSPFHFTRIFARSIGVTPYRYVVHLRLKAAIDRIRGGMSLAQVAADTGFSDQSHLSRWIRRVHGIPPSEVT